MITPVDSITMTNDSVTTSIPDAETPFVRILVSNMDDDDDDDGNDNIDDKSADDNDDDDLGIALLP